jgi:hypothetical protein
VIRKSVVLEEETFLSSNHYVFDALVFANDSQPCNCIIP